MLLRQPAQLRDGTPVPNGTQAEVRRSVDGSLIATVESQNGWFTLQTNGNPGPHYFKLTYGGEIHYAYSQTTGASGPTLISLLPQLFRVWTDGYINGVLGNLAVSASGLGMNVTVAPGIGVARGIVYDQFENVTLSIQPSVSQGRIDRVVLEVVPPGNLEEGRARLLVLTGTPSGAPQAPALTQTTEVYQVPLALVTVDANVSTVAGNKITDQRTISGVEIQDGAVTTPKLADKAVTAAKIADDTITAAQIAANAIGNAELANNAVTYNKIAANSIDQSKITTGATRSTSEIAAIARADYTTENPTFAPITLGELSNVSTLAPSTNQVLGWNGTEWAPTNAPSGGGGSRQVKFNDANFAATGNLGGTRNLATASVTLEAGNWMVESQVHLTARGTPDSGTFVARLTGNGTPQGVDVSSRIFQTVGGVPRQVLLTGRVYLSLGSTTTVSATGQVQYDSGAVSDIRDGVVYMVATPR